MINVLKPATALCAVLALAACNQQASVDSGDAEVALETDVQRLSYGVALGLGRNMARDGMQVDVDAFAAGLSDAVSGEPQRLSDEEIQAEMVAFQERLNSERQAQAEALAESNASAAAAFLAENGGREGVVTTETGLQYEVLEAGDGAKPGPGDSVQVHYRGTLIDGTEFDSSYARGEPVTFGVGQVISGWTEALQLMSVGSKYKLYIPSELAYGSGGAGDRIGPNAALIFEVELLDIPSQQASAEGESSEG
ncbi:MAG: FKBP-type peptidyl-prolyl cis-trans isomerase [Halieaceae bacterium]|jgi:FKBP-type peptidyl-prolyl cis-trans isomerase|nr:FKBP-type peptidyl-prolyl cis-trans isomerase [Halieaceae bacterium]